MRLRVLNLDGSVSDQAGLIEQFAPDQLDCADWGPRLRLACGHRIFRRFQEHLGLLLGPQRRGAPALTLLGSGDFHHVTLALLRQLTEPFNLLVIDKHPDWMRGVPLLHCGSWLRHALRLPTLQRVFHVGGDLDFDNWYRLLAPWSEIRSGRITVIPARRRFQAGAWASLPHRPLLRPGNFDVESALDEALRMQRRDLQRFPLYISLDKDVMSAEEAVVNWDSGTLGFAEVLEVLKWFERASDGRLAGMDVVGDWSPVHLRPGVRTLCHWIEHPSLQIDPDLAAQLNQRMNKALAARALEWTQELAAPRRIAAA
jgi:hypothetical protein